MVLGGCFKARVSACSYSRRRPSCEVKRSTVSRIWELTPTVRIMASVSVIAETTRWYSDLILGSAT